MGAVTPTVTPGLRKVSAAAIGGAAVIIGNWVLHAYFGVQTPGEVGAAEALLVTSLLTLFVPEKYQLG